RNWNNKPRQKTIQGKWKKRANSSIQKKKNDRPGIIFNVFHFDHSQPLRAGCFVMVLYLQDKDLVGDFMIVVSDLMGTLTTGAPFLGLVDWVRHNQSRLHANMYIASILPSYLLAKSGLIDSLAWGQKLMLNSLSYIKDADEEKVRHVSEWVVEQNLWKKRREDVVARLINHREEGAQVYIASSVVEPFIEPFANRIGAQVVGTPTEIVEGRLRSIGELVADEKKIERVLSRVGVERVDVAYGDTVLDLPLLEHAEHPVAVYPEAKLKSIALERGWEIMGDTPDYM
ncbi:MAG TPA: haloacid dehalogenase-like hydrolase, partial [Anaerolineales bacterium]|nr:haloacid dehalogenase-like hydrolase [Anaerolineales bacterium]